MMIKKALTVSAICILCCFLSCNGQWGEDNDPQWDETEKSRQKRQAGHIWPEADPGRRYPGNKYDPYCPPNDPWPCYYPPYYPYDAILKDIRDIGIVVGRSWMYRDGVEKKYLNIFLGIPYARMPINERRFKVSTTGQIAMKHLSLYACNERSLLMLYSCVSLQKTAM